MAFQDAFGHKAAANHIGRASYRFNASAEESPDRGTHRRPSVPTG
jgi:hypothetical protein